ncbi:MAG: DUF835 domain-containing protein [Methanobacteriota archaeon]|nr:MAG: DUF835 domain-containing protein [Euryarchaeota archaeon]
MAKDTQIELAKGKSYLNKEKRPELSYRAFEGNVNKKTPGLCISREHPSRLEKRFKNTRLIWISQTPGKDYYEPTALNSITKLVCQFVEEKERCVVLLDCLEYLIVHNGFEHSFKGMELINEFVMQRDASVIIPLNPDALEPRQVSLLERGLEVVEPGEAKASVVDEDIVDLMEKY